MDEWIALSHLVELGIGRGAVGVEPVVLRCTLDGLGVRRDRIVVLPLAQRVVPRGAQRGDRVVVGLLGRGLVAAHGGGQGSRRPAACGRAQADEHSGRDWTGLLLFAPNGQLQGHS